MAFRIDQQSSLEFEVTQTLDAGNSSQILMAECTDNRDLKVAIKRCRPDRKNADDWLMQVEREISALHHVNSIETPDWSFDMSLRNRLNLTYSTVADRSIIQLISLFDMDGLPAIALEIAPPSITTQQLDKYTTIDVMHQLAQTTHLIHENGVAFTDFDPLVKIPRIRWDANAKRIKIIDWNVTRETEDYKRRDLIFLGRIYFQLLSGYPAWAKHKPEIDGLPNRINEYALDITGAASDKWRQTESALRDVIERLMIEDTNNTITSSEKLLSEMEWIKELADYAQRIENGSATALNEMEGLLQEASNAHPPQLRRIADIGSFFLPVAGESRKAVHENQVDSANRLLKSAYLDRIAQANEYIDKQQYSDAVAELENARSRFMSNQMLSNATHYRYVIANIGEAIQQASTLDAAKLKDLIDKLLLIVGGLESRLWDTHKAEKIRDDINKSFPPNIISMPDIQKIFEDIEASKLYESQVHIIESTHRIPHIEKGWEIREQQRLDQYNQIIIPALQKAQEQSLIENRVMPRLERLQQAMLADQKDLNMVKKFLEELAQGVTSINIEEYLAQTTLDRPYAPLTISRDLLPRDQSDLSADEVSGVAIERYQQFRKQWDSQMASPTNVQEKISQLSQLVSENEDMIEIFREKLPTVIIPGETIERKTVYRDLEDLTQFVNAVESVYDELGSIGLNRIPNISRIQKKWMFVTNVQDPDLKRFVHAIESNLATHTNEKVQDKSLPPELAMLVYEMLDVPIPTSVMQVGQEIQLHKYLRTTLRKSTTQLQSIEEVDGVIGELTRLTRRNLGDLDEAISQVMQKLEQYRDGLNAKTIVRQIRTFYRVMKRKIEAENKEIQQFSEQIDEAVDDLINQKVRLMEVALDKAKTNEPLDREQEALVRETQRVLDTLRHNNLLQERRWHHVQNSQAYLLREHSRTLEQTTTSFNTFKYSEARRQIERAFYLSKLFDMPHDDRLTEELHTAEEMVEQLREHFTITRGIDTVNPHDISKMIEEEIEYWLALREIVKELALEATTEDDIELEFDATTLEKLVTALKQADAVAENMHDTRRAVTRLRELEKSIDIYELEDVLTPLKNRLDDLLKYNYTKVLSKQITEIEEIASQQRIISNESVINRVRDGYMLIDLNKQLNILDANESSNRLQQLQSNSYTAIKNLHLKNRDERQALAEFIDSLPQQELQSREFQGVFTRLAEDPISYSYLAEQVHSYEMTQTQTGVNRTRRILIIIVIIAIVAVVAGLTLSGNLPIDGFTLPFQN